MNKTKKTVTKFRKQTVIAPLQRGKVGITCRNPLKYSGFAALLQKQKPFFEKKAAGIAHQ